MNPPTPRYPWGLRLIGAFKFVSGLLLVAVGVGLFRHATSDPAEAFGHLVASLKLDPDNHYIHSAITKVSGISPKQLRAISVGTFLYALMYLIEGTGLLIKARWGEYVTVVATGFFIPLEIYEIARRFTAIRVGILTINVAIVVYLVYQVLKRRREEAGQTTSSPSSPASSDPVT